MNVYGESSVSDLPQNMAKPVILSKYLKNGHYIESL